MTEFFALLDEPKSNEESLLEEYTTGSRKVCIVQTAQELKEAITSLRKTKLIGFDSEQKPTFKKGEKANKISLIQMANATECYLIQVLKIKDITPLLDFIRDRNFIKIGINLVGDKKALYDEYKIHMKGTLDLDTIFSKLTAKNSIGAKKVAKVFLKRNLQKSKKVSVSNWEADALSDKQIKYASEDATVVYDTIIHLINEYPFVLKAMPQWFEVDFNNGEYDISSEV
ncbi:3'-5' exonuclease domain-containing protein 2 [Sulfurimonas sp. SAG-AH-194-C21]|nr:3'-5' exonuclease [Sulfurimonas sp. SAG-AH-194-C21]MDF1882550.1 3'-5' exonuclease domain-containing protein 2 [Sulfurimonas sp. SAG-AH-194-C21]